MIRGRKVAEDRRFSSPPFELAAFQPTGEEMTSIKRGNASRIILGSMDSPLREVNTTTSYYYFTNSIYFAHSAVRNC